VHGPSADLVPPILATPTILPDVYKETDFPSIIDQGNLIKLDRELIYIRKQKNRKEQTIPLSTNRSSTPPARGELTRLQA